MKSISSYPPVSELQTRGAICRAAFGMATRKLRLLYVETTFVHILEDFFYLLRALYPDLFYQRQRYTASRFIFRVLYRCEVARMEQRVAEAALARREQAGTPDADTRDRTRGRVFNPPPDKGEDNSPR